MTPDWAAKPTAVPYANYGNPQSLNLYSYVENNPTTTADLDGHQQCTGGGSGNAEGLGLGPTCDAAQKQKSETEGVTSQAQQQNNRDQNQRNQPMQMSGSRGKGGGQGKGERKQTSKPEGTPNPTKGVRPVRDNTGKVVGWSMPSPDGKRIPKTLEWGKANGLDPNNFRNAAKTATAIGTIGVGAMIVHDLIIGGEIAAGAAAF